MLKVNRLQYIDCLKGFAILGVIICHYAQQYNVHNIIINRICELGGSFPQLFFVISAFLTWNSLSKQTAVKSGYMRFVSGKFERLAPAYILAVILSVFVYDYSFSPLCLISHLFLLNGLFPSYINVWFGEWYVADLFLFFLLVPLLFKYVRNVKSALIAYSIALLLDLLCISFSNHFWQAGFTYSDSVVFGSWNIIYHLPTLMLGILSFYFVKSSRRRRVATISCIVLVMMAICCKVVMHFGICGAALNIFKGPLFASFFTLVATLRIPEFRLLNTLGRRSYGLYVTHTLIISVLHHFHCLDVMTNLFFIDWMIRFVVVVALSYLIGWLFEEIYPFLKTRLSIATGNGRGIANHLF